VSPKQIENLQKESEGDMEYVDGFEDMTKEMQEKILRALEQGHVDDADWKHGQWNVPRLLSPQIIDILQNLN